MNREYKIPYIPVRSEGIGVHPFIIFYQFLIFIILVFLAIPNYSFREITVWSDQIFLCFPGTQLKLPHNFYRNCFYMPIKESMQSRTTVSTLCYILVYPIKLLLT